MVIWGVVYGIPRTESWIPPSEMLRRWMLLDILIKRLTDTYVYLYIYTYNMCVYVYPDIYFDINSDIWTFLLTYFLTFVDPINRPTAEEGEEEEVAAKACVVPLCCCFLGFRWSVRIPLKILASKYH